MQLLRKPQAISTFGDERFHRLNFVQGARFEGTRVVENELWVAPEYELVFDTMDSTGLPEDVRMLLVSHLPSSSSYLLLIAPKYYVVSWAT